LTTQADITQRTHRRAVRFFWGFLIGATTVSLIGNITHTVRSYIPAIVIEIGAAAVPPVALLAVHGIAREQFGNISVTDRNIFFAA